jgi:hypothetical protein
MALASSYCVNSRALLRFTRPGIRCDMPANVVHVRGRIEGIGARVGKGERGTIHPTPQTFPTHLSKASVPPKIAPPILAHTKGGTLHGPPILDNGRTGAAGPFARLRGRDGGSGFLLAGGEGEVGGEYPLYREVSHSQPLTGPLGPQSPTHHNPTATRFSAPKEAGVPR